MTETHIHIRFQCCSKPLWEKLIELGFEERGSDPDSWNTKRVRRFYKNNLIIEDSYSGVYLYAITEQSGIKGIPQPTKILKYHGLSLNKDLLENFAKKGIYNK